MKIIAFGASYSRASINKEFAAFAATQFGTHEVEVLDLNDYSLPLFTVDVEKELGQPQAAKDFVAKMEEADALIISVTEHNGNFSAAFKNLFDWASRIKLNMFEGKRMLLLSTSPGQGGGQYALEIARGRFPRHGGIVVAHFSLPKFGDNYVKGQGIMHEALRGEFEAALQTMKTALL
jgi:NAD(P)H-dependent FMN reductase